MPVASGGTLAGLATSRSRINKILGIAVLKGEHYLEQLVENLIGDHEISTPYQIDHRFHQGGYAKSCAELTQFCIHQSQLLQVPLEPVYSGKVLFALKKIVESKQLPVGSRLLFLHTGGIQAQN